MNQNGFDLDEFLTGDTVVRIKYKDRILRHHFREKDQKTDLHYQRKLAKFRSARSGGLIPEDDSLHADIFLYDSLCKKVEVEDGEQLIDVPDFKARLSPDLKRHAIFAYQRRLGEAEEEEVKNS